MCMRRKICPIHAAAGDLPVNARGGPLYFSIKEGEIFWNSDECYTRSCCVRTPWSVDCKHRTSIDVITVIYTYIQCKLQHKY